MTVICSKLSYSTNYYHIFTISNKDTTLDRSSKYKTILTIINVYIGSYIKNKVFTIFTIVNIELLTFYGIDRLCFELILLIFEIIVLRINFLFFECCWENVVLWLWFLCGNLLRFFRLLDNRRWRLNNIWLILYRSYWILDLLFSWWLLFNFVFAL